jgi:hypothetical protein
MSIAAEVMCVLTKFNKSIMHVDASYLTEPNVSQLRAMFG